MPERMVGRDSGVVRVHAKAIVITKTTASAKWPVGGGSLWSRTSFKSISGDNVVDADNEVKSSPGCLPIIVSIATTPKL
uniref:Uncharacterized protein n=1 Tax=Solanum lycopersicum TaxID=4081 RepID=A0A3Q7I6Q3_SOLLC